MQKKPALGSITSKGKGDQKYQQGFFSWPLAMPQSYTPESLEWDLSFCRDFETVHLFVKRLKYGER